MNNNDAQYNIFEQLAAIYKLKSVNRDTFVDDRQESTPEHTWSMFILADYFLETYKYELDRTRVYQMITYHDLAEVKIGDIPLKDQDLGDLDKKSMEHKALLEIRKELPAEFSEFVYLIISEYEARNTPESKFVKAVDFIDNELTCLSYEYKYKSHGYSRFFLQSKFIEKTDSFKEIGQFYFEILDYIESKGLFNT